MNIEDNPFDSIKCDKDSPWQGLITLANGKTATVDLDVDETRTEIMNGVLWILRSGARWKDLLDKFPPYQI